MVALGPGSRIFSLLILVFIGLTACGGVRPATKVAAPTTVVTRVVEVPVTPTASPVPEGGWIVRAIFEEPKTFNPILAADPSSRTMTDLLYLGLVRPHPKTGQLQGVLARSWEYSEDARTITFHLRDDVLWSDGVPLTAWDVKFTLEAVASDQVNSPLRRVLTNVASVRVVGDYTMQLHLAEPDCTLLADFTFGMLPAHRFAEDFSDIRGNSQNLSPVVSSGPLRFRSWERGQAVEFVRNERYFLSAPHLEGVRFRLFQNRKAALDAFLSGEVDILELEPSELTVVEGAIAHGEPYALRRILSDGYVFLGLNLADPAQPELGWRDVDEDGEKDAGEVRNASQAPHPVFGDQRVRQAVAHAIDAQNIINTVVFGEGVQIPANVLPSVRWAFDEDLGPYAYDEERSRELLERAGWTDENEDGTREKDGSSLRAVLLVNEENEQRVRIAEMVSDDLVAVGFDISLEVVEWPNVLWQQLGQRFDLVVSEWAGLGFDPHDDRLWSFSTDDPADTANFGSFYDAVVEREFEAARTQPSCAQEARAMRYRTIQNRIHEQAPYVFLYVPFKHVVWTTRLQGIDPSSWSLDHGFEDWYLRPAPDS